MVDYKHCKVEEGLQTSDVVAIIFIIAFIISILALGASQ